MSRNTTIDNIFSMAAPELRAIAKADVPYADRDLPLTFFGVNHSRWSKGDMVIIIETLGGAATANDTRFDLHQTIHRRYNPRRITQRTINALEETALAAAGQSERSQRQVREAAQGVTAERADLARERRAAARVPPAAPAINQNHQTKNWRQRKLRIRQETWAEFFPASPFPESPFPDRATDVDNIGVTPQAASRVHTVQAEVIGDDFVEIRPRTGPRVYFADEEVGTGSTRKRRSENVAEQPAERRTGRNKEASIDTLGRPFVVFGTSPAIQETAAFRRGLELADFPATRNQLSCQVFSDDLDSLLPYQVTVGARCNHAPEICLACWKRHIAAQADTKTWDAITCPTPTAKPNSTMTTCRDLQANRALQDTSGYRPCAQEGCESGAVIEPEPEATFMTCHDCNRDTCLGCNLVYHPDQTCDEYRRWLADAPGGDKKMK